VSGGWSEAAGGSGPRPGLCWPVAPARARAAFAVGRFASAVLSSRCAAADARWLVRRGAFLVVRLDAPPGRLPAPARFVARHAGWVARVDPSGWYQILDAPDRSRPRLAPAAFAAWWGEVVERLQERFPGLHPGFPAPAGDADPSAFADRGVLARAAFIGERGLWPDRPRMADPAFGWRWARSAGLGLPILLTAFGCTGQAESWAARAVQLLDYCASLPRHVRAVGGLVGPAGQLDERMCELIGRYEGIPRGVRMAEEQVRKLADEIIRAARAHGLAPSLVAGLIDVESGGNPRAVSPDNGPGLGRALGLMQVLEGHFAPGQDPFDPAVNLAVGCALLRDRIAAFGGRVESGLAAYFGAVDAAGRPTEARDATGTSGTRYVALVLGAARRYADLDVRPDPLAGPLADPDFRSYAPRTGTWREAAINLKGIADRALESGRQIVAEIEQTAARARATWGGQ